MRALLKSTESNERFIQKLNILEEYVVQKHLVEFFLDQKLLKPYHFLCAFNQ